MSNQKIADLLSKHQLRNTGKRRDVLSVFVQNDHALSSKMIESKLEKFDRVTLYRILNSFEESGLIHKVVNNKSEVFYAKCSGCSHKHVDNHMHFHCTSCEKIYCLDDIPQSSFKTPEGFKLDHYQLDVYGVCKNCNK